MKDSNTPGNTAFSALRGAPVGARRARKRSRLTRLGDCVEGSSQTRHNETGAHQWVKRRRPDPALTPRTGPPRHRCLHTLIAFSPRLSWIARMARRRSRHGALTSGGTTEPASARSRFLPLFAEFLLPQAVRGVRERRSVGRHKQGRGGTCGVALSGFGLCGLSPERRCSRPLVAQ